MDRESRLIQAFPGLAAGAFQITSRPTPVYNCIAWAAGDTERFWWPRPEPFYYWPSGVPRVETLAAFIEAFRTVGYSVCGSGTLEAGYEKIAIFVSSIGTPTHASRQLPSGLWTSKLGNEDDISHDRDGVSGNHYGAISTFMSRLTP